ncbi:MAG TPA: porin [Allosphingosinicella sp.]|uniref:OprO/OprP family phosphate-selective porin n=1 Tax=Allosphingosinicella sp. TaxID=2823234 RepID=UPI002ED97152
MTTKAFTLALLAGSSTLMLASPAFAQAEAAPAEEAVAPLDAEGAAAKAAFLEAQVEALQQQLDELKKQMGVVTPGWKGAPLYEDKEAGWSFKPRGRIQYDVGFIENPDDRINSRNLGFNTRVRRIRLGAEGTIPGDFGYKFEMDFANSAVGFGDAIITYAPKGKPWSLTIGNHETFESLEQITSSRFISFLERAQMNDAFGHTRRIGLSFGLADKANIARLNAGIFAAHSIDASFDNDGWIGAARATYSPQALGGLLHLGANLQHREFQSNNGGTASSSTGAPSTNQLARYRARPFLQTTDVRFVDTGSFAASSDDIYGVELGGIFKSLHLAGEAQWTKVNAYSTGDVATGLDAFSAANTALVPSGDPSFFSWYAEAGYFLTGETRGYKNGAWDRTKVLNPFSKGGSGAFQINARYDYLDLDSDKLKQGFTNNFTTGLFTPSNSLSRGGIQTGYQASLIWIPEDYVRFLLQYTRTQVEGGPFAAAVKPTSTEPVDERSYGVNSVALRAQVDF